MALRTSTMHMPFSDQTLDAPSEQYHLPRKVTIVLLLVAAACLWLYVLIRERFLPYSTPVQEIMAGIVIGIVSALGSQLMLSQRDGMMRFVVSMAADVAGVYLLGFVSNGKYGISKFGWLPGSMDYDGLNLIGIGFVIVLFASLLVRRTRVIVIPESAPLISPDSDLGSSTSIQMEPSSSISISNQERPRVSWSRIFMPSAPSHPRSNGRHSGMVRPAKVAPAVAPKRRRRNKRARVQLALVEEHRCPYCFDTVARSDPRGVKECSVCHTLHHKDCWDVTGSCQVPHLNT